jgi:hypothetical protein
MSADDRERVATNPFHVLGLRPDASPAEVEREGQRLLDALALGFDDARLFSTALGPRERTAEDVRAALAELRDPERRVQHEIFAVAAAVTPVAVAAPGPARWPEAFETLGWGARCSP